MYYLYRPFFRILYDDGDAEEVSGHELEQLVLPRESRTPLSAPQLFDYAGRKNDQYRGSFLDVAAPLNGQRGLYHALLRGKNHFKTGFVLRTVYNDGTPADPEKFLGHWRFVAFLRAALLSIGFASEDVGLFAAHSLRAGGATAAAVGKLSQHGIAMVSATSSTCWLEWYDRRSLVRRLQLSRSIGC